MPPIAQYVFNGVVTGGILALPAVAFSLLWRLLRFPNFAVSTYLTVGAYVALVLNHGARASIELAWLGALVVTGVVALAVDHIAFRPMRDRRPFSLAIASIGVAFVLENVVRFIWGNDFRSFDVPVTRGMSIAGLRIGREQLLILGVAVALMALAQAFLLRTRLGIAMRATADNPRLAAVKGVPTERVIALATLGGGAVEFLHALVERVDLVSGKKIALQEGHGVRDPCVPARIVLPEMLMSVDDHRIHSGSAP